ncbi:hypothetical protein F4Z99_09055 [Candidatus Poribacteria bacterium]|nr:hypothetical protein [Candidatus Poribacteria bacterium]MYA99497.1 hypothetical protein [Candidatus Poribacteria bacterium]
MRNDRTDLCVLSVLLIGLLFIVSIADAQNVAELREAMDDAEDFVDDKVDDHGDANDHLNQQVANFVRLHGHLVGIELPSQSPATHTQALIVKTTQIVEKLIQANQLTSAMEQQLAAIETQRTTCNNLWADVQLAQTAYEDAIDAYNEEVSPNEQITTVEVPQAPPVAYLYLCPGPCSTAFTTQVLATTTHKVFCQESPCNGTSRSYYSCPPNYENICPGKWNHQTPCRGGCGTLFADNTGPPP